MGKFLALAVGAVVLSLMLATAAVAGDVLPEGGAPSPMGDVLPEGG